MPLEQHRILGHNLLTYAADGQQAVYTPSLVCASGTLPTQKQSGALVYSWLAKSAQSVSHPLKNGGWQFRRFSLFLLPVSPGLPAGMPTLFKRAVVKQP